MSPKKKNILKPPIKHLSMRGHGSVHNMATGPICEPTMIAAIKLQHHYMDPLLGVTELRV
jgi:hypothetical protein